MTSEQVIAAAMVVIAVATLALAAIAIQVAVKGRASYERVNALIDRLNGSLAPLISHATAIADHVNYITRSLRDDARLINRTVATANDRVQDAVAVTEQRLNEFNALLSVVQDEAEQVFVSTAATVRGVRSGAASFRERGGTDLASDELDEGALTDFEPEEEQHGNNNPPGGSEEAIPAPRIRSRARGGRRP